MKKSLLLFVAIVVFNQLFLAQEYNVANKLFYSELGGPGVIMSVNFDSRFDSSSQFGLGFRLGVGFGYGEFRSKGFGPFGEYYNYVTRTYYSIPTGLNYVFGKPGSPHTFETGVGVTFLTRRVALYNFGGNGDGNLIGHLSFMYRRIPENGGFSWRIGLTPIIGTSGNLFPMGAIGFGYAF